MILNVGSTLKIALNADEDKGEAYEYGLLAVSKTRYVSPLEKPARLHSLKGFPGSGPHVVAPKCPSSPNLDNA